MTVCICNIVQVQYYKSTLTLRVVILYIGLLLLVYAYRIVYNTCSVLRLSKMMARRVDPAARLIVFAIMQFIRPAGF